MTLKFNNLYKVIYEGVSKRRAQPGMEYVHDIHYIITRYLGFVEGRSVGGRVQYKRAQDGTTLGMVNIKRIPKGAITSRGDWKRILAKVFWWVPAAERDELWTKARATRGKDSAVQPPSR